MGFLGMIERFMVDFPYRCVSLAWQYLKEPIRNSPWGLVYIDSIYIYIIMIMYPVRHRPILDRSFEKRNKRESWDLSSKGRVLQQGFKMSMAKKHHFIQYVHKFLKRTKRE